MLQRRWPGHTIGVRVCVDECGGLRRSEAPALREALKR
jgi:hypothetical protein